MAAKLQRDFSGGSSHDGYDGDAGNDAEYPLVMMSSTFIAQPSEDPTKQVYCCFAARKIDPERNQYITQMYLYRRVPSGQGYPKLTCSFLSSAQEDEAKRTSFSDAFRQIESFEKIQASKLQPYPELNEEDCHFSHFHSLYEKELENNPQETAHVTAVARVFVNS